MGTLPFVIREIDVRLALGQTVVRGQVVRGLLELRRRRVRRRQLDHGGLGRRGERLVELHRVLGEVPRLGLARVDGSTPQRHAPRIQIAHLVRMRRIKHAQLPLAHRRLVPVLERHERPSGEAGGGIVVAARARQRRLGAVGRDELHVDVAAALVGDPDAHRDVLERCQVGVAQVILGDGESRLGARLGDERLGSGQRDVGRLVPRLWIDELVALGLLYKLVGVDEAVAVLVVESGDPPGSAASPGPRG